MTKYVYESPDRGETVYRREFGSDVLTLHSMSEETKQHLARVAHERLWADINRMAKTDSALQELIEQVELYYKLKYL